MRALRGQDLQIEVALDTIHVGVAAAVDFKSAVPKRFHHLGHTGSGLEPEPYHQTCQSLNILTYILGGSL
jgi:hypothetical protein